MSDIDQTRLPVTCRLCEGENFAVFYDALAQGLWVECKDCGTVLHV